MDRTYQLTSRWYSLHVLALPSQDGIWWAESFSTMPGKMPVPLVNSPKGSESKLRHQRRRQSNSPISQRRRPKTKQARRQGRSRRARRTSIEAPKRKASKRQPMPSTSWRERRPSGPGACAPLPIQRSGAGASNTKGWARSNEAARRAKRRFMAGARQHQAQVMS